MGEGCLLANLEGTVWIFCLSACLDLGKQLQGRIALTALSIFDCWRRELWVLNGPCSVCVGLVGEERQAVHLEMVGVG